MLSISISGWLSISAWHYAWWHWSLGKLQHCHSIPSTLSNILNNISNKLGMRESSLRNRTPWRRLRSTISRISVPIKFKLVEYIFVTVAICIFDTICIYAFDFLEYFHWNVFYTNIIRYIKLLFFSSRIIVRWISIFY